MEAGLYFPVYRRCFRGGNTIFSLWSLSRFVTKLFIYIQVSLVDPVISLEDINMLIIILVVDSPTKYPIHHSTTGVSCFTVPREA